MIILKIFHQHLAMRLNQTILELLGIAIIPLEIAVTTNNFWGYVLGVLGFGVAVVGCFLKDNH